MTESLLLGRFYSVERIFFVVVKHDCFFENVFFSLDVGSCWWSKLVFFWGGMFCKIVRISKRIVNKDGDNSDIIRLVNDLANSPKLMNEFMAQPRLLPTAEEYISYCMNLIEKRISVLLK